MSSRDRYEFLNFTKSDIHFCKNKKLYYLYSREMAYPRFKIMDLMDSDVQKLYLNIGIKKRLYLEIKEDGNIIVS